MDYILLILGLVILVVGANLLTKGCVGMAARFRVPEFIVGLTVMAVGTSMPEFTVSAMSALKGSTEMAIGNVTGSNIFNILVILGICAMVRPMVFTRENIRRDLPICIVASAMLLIFALYIGQTDGISRLEAAFMLACYVGVTYFSIQSAKKDVPDADAGTTDGSSSGVDMAWGRVIIYIIVGLAGLIFGGNMCLESATAIARAWGVSEAVIAITIVAAGTSLPELASSLAAVTSGKLSLALGNVVGSNIANILLILGTCGVIKPLTMGSISPLDIWMVLVAAVLLLISAIFVGQRRITRGEGLLYFAVYVGYVLMLMK